MKFTFTSEHAVAHWIFTNNKSNFAQLIKCLNHKCQMTKAYSVFEQSVHNVSAHELQKHTIEIYRKVIQLLYQWTRNHCTKFRQIRSFHCGDIAIFWIFTMAAVRHLDSFRAYLNHLQWVLGGLYHSAKFDYDRCSSIYNINISIFGAFGWKMRIHVPKIGVLGQFDPLNGLQYPPKPRGTPLRESASFEPLSVKMWAVWPVGELLGVWIKKLVIFHLFAQKPLIDGFPPNFAQL